MRQPNPLDPLDGVKRWYHDLWPIERLGVAAALAGVLVLLLLYVTR